MNQAHIIKQERFALHKAKDWEAINAFLIPSFDSDSCSVCFPQTTVGIFESLYCTRKERESRGCSMLEIHAKRISREESTQHTYNPYLGLWQSVPRKKQKRKHFCHKVHAHSCGARLTRRTLAKEPWRACFLLTHECPGRTDWRAKPSSMEARLLTAIFQDQPDSLASTQETWVIFLVKHNESV